MKLLKLFVVILTIAMISAMQVIYKSGTAAIDLPETQGDWLTIHPAVVVDVSGTVVAWEFVAKKTGTIILSLWDPLEQDRYRLHNKTYINVMSVGRQVFKVPETNWYPARVGQVIGVHSIDASGGGIIPRTPADCCGLKVKPSHVAGVYDSSLILGYTVTNNKAHRRTKAVLVHIQRDPVITVTGGDPSILEENIPNSCIPVPPHPPEMLSVHLDFLYPLPDLFVNVSVRDTGCDQVFVYWPVFAEENGRKTLHRLCPTEQQINGDHSQCGFSCRSPIDPSEQMKSTINIRVLQRKHTEGALCSLDLMNL